MVTLTKYGAKYNRNILFLEGLSTDTKPTGKFDGLSIQNGSEYTEVDTGKKFLFDYDNATWYEVQVALCPLYNNKSNFIATNVYKAMCMDLAGWSFNNVIVNGHHYRMSGSIFALDE